MIAENTPGTDKLDRIAYCGADCAACPDYRQEKCPGCRRSEWPDGDPCAPVACCRGKGIGCCGECPEFPCRMMQDFYAESESHRDALARMRTVARFPCRTLRQMSGLKERAAAWFHSKWGVPEAAYLACMDACLSGESEYDWYLCLDGDRIVGGLGVIENDFHDRKDLSPNVCAVYTEPAYRGQGIAGRLLRMAVEDMRAKGITPLYLLTDHTGFYERYGWEFFCMAQGDGEARPSRLYIHR